MEELKLENLPIDLMVTYRCNLHCKKCYSPKVSYEASYTEITKTLDKLYEIGIRRLVLTGGEPLVRTDIASIAKYAKEKGFYVYLSTNGIYLKKIWNDIMPYLSWVSISLDGPSEDINKLIIGERGGYHFCKVLEFLKYYGSFTNQNVKIKLGTVVAKKNMDHLVSLGKVIFKKQDGYVPDIWRLYQFSSFVHHNDNYSYINEFNVTEKELHSAIAQIKKAFPEIDITYATANERDEAYIFVTPEQKLVYSSNGSYVEIGDARLLSPQQILNVLFGVHDIWGKCIVNRLMYD